MRASQHRCRPGARRSREPGIHNNREEFWRETVTPSLRQTSPWGYGSRIGARLRARLSGTTAGLVAHVIGPAVTFGNETPGWLFSFMN